MGRLTWEKLQVQATGAQLDVIGHVTDNLRQPIHVKASWSGDLLPCGGVGGGVSGGRGGRGGGWDGGRGETIFFGHPLRMKIGVVAAGEGGVHRCDGQHGMIVALCRCVTVVVPAVGFHVRIDDRMEIRQPWKTLFDVVLLLFGQFQVAAHFGAEGVRIETSGRAEAEELTPEGAADTSEFQDASGAALTPAIDALIDLRRLKQRRAAGRSIDGVFDAVSHADIDDIDDVHFRAHHRARVTLHPRHERRVDADPRHADVPVPDEGAASDVIDAVGAAAVRSWARVAHYVFDDKRRRYLVASSSIWLLLTPSSSSSSRNSTVSITFSLSLVSLTLSLSLSRSVLSIWGVSNESLFNWLSFTQRIC